MSKAHDGTAPAPALRIEARGYRSLRYVSQPLNRFHVLLGPNASGKSSFLDAIAFLADLLRGGVEAAVHGDARFGIPLRAPDGRQLTWMRRSDRFELAVELAIPEALRDRRGNRNPETCRYEVAIDVGGPLRLARETLWLKPAEAPQPRPRQPAMFPEPREIPESIVSAPGSHAPKGWKRVVSRAEEAEQVYYRSETSGWSNPFRIGADRAALASLPEDEERFPVATWFRRRLSEGVERLALSGEAMRRASPPGSSRGYRPDGSNLAHVVHRLEAGHPDRLERWIRHVREALPDLESIWTRERDEDRHRYLVLRYASGLEAPSWLVSEGSLRLLALTLLAYIPDLSGIYLIEEPENGIHARAVETVFQSLASVYGAQILLATHSPMIASAAELDQVLCFAKTEAGETDLVAGTEHPRLREWKGSFDLGTLLAAGVLA